MSVYNEIMQKLEKGKVHMTLIDPAAQSYKRGGEIAEEAENAGTDFIMVGGSTNIDTDGMDQCIDYIQQYSSLKVIIFPGSHAMISSRADAIYFMSLLNSRNPEFIIRQQARGAVYLRKIGMETIPMGYLVIEPGMTVGRVGEVDLIGTDDNERALSFAIAAETFGMKFVYLEAGSGAGYPVKEAMISLVKKGINIPLIVGGGIRTPAAARNAAKAGADIVVTGTVAEKSANVTKTLTPIISAIKSEVLMDKI
ncbi:MAG: geranylgeranylglyceryl/heptaprenylglyceryl phosphate synthase [Candidatus Thermoplasmatota archaeon]|nr:geranylgeranylglyceryl/heptaprenylglyceryl phosphate synthase [Candidatus Thermoplasmatota archaeon]